MKRYVTPMQILAAKTNFIIKAQAIHGDKYDYSNSVYTSSKDDVNVACPTHGEFMVRAGDHIRKRGVSCPGCRAEIPKPIGLGRTRTHEHFLAKAIQTHGSKYGYAKTIYVKSSLLVTITCPFHGDFLQTPSNHIAGRGCPACYTRNRKQPCLPK